MQHLAKSLISRSLLGYNHENEAPKSEQAKIKPEVKRYESIKVNLHSFKAQQRWNKAQSVHFEVAFIGYKQSK